MQYNVDHFGDSYARDVSIEELKELLDSMPSGFDRGFHGSRFRSELLENDDDLRELPGWMFKGLVIYLDVYSANGDGPQASRQSHGDRGLAQAGKLARFAGAQVTGVLRPGVTHVLVGENRSQNQALRRQVSSFGRLPRLVSVGWVEQSWEEKTRLDEERFGPL